MQESKTVLNYQSRKSVDGVCRRCDSRNIVSSKYRGIERSVVSIFPANVYRCVDCYNRFWSYESLFLYKRRAIFWLSVLIFAVIITFLKIQKKTEYLNSELNRGAEVELFEEAQTDSPSSSASVIEIVTESEGADIQKKPLLDDVSMVETAGDLADVEDDLRPVETHAESVLRLEQALTKDRVALESLLKVDMGYRIERWVDAWETGLSDYYLDFYSSSFEPQGDLSYSTWVEQRKSRVKPEKKIKIVLSNINVGFSSDMTRSVVTMDQHYQSHSFSEHIMKKMVWVKEKASWKIVSEQQIDF